MTQAARFTDEQYLSYDPFEGERDTDVRLRSVRLVVARKAHPCFGLSEADQHEIQPGERYRLERALIDGDYWGQYRVCLSCMDKWLSEVLLGEDEGDEVGHA